MKAAEIRWAVDRALEMHRRFGVGSAYHVSPESALEDALSEMTGEFRSAGAINGPATVKNLAAAARKAWPAERGGRRSGQGRKAEDGAAGVVRVTIQLTPAQRDKVRANGGSAWVRGLIDAS
jgi:hypothetical protein